MCDTLGIMAKTYTRAGDTGTTGHPQQGRIGKGDEVIEIVGLFDEAQVSMGYTLSLCGVAPFDELKNPLERCMNSLFACATFALSEDDLLLETAWLEKEIDRMEASLPPLRSFIKPSGCELACRIHLARVQVRRLERLLWEKNLYGLWVTAEAAPFINRLSDYLFIASRYVNQLDGCGDQQFLKAT